MKPAQPHTWISYYIYYSDDPDALLTKVIWPLTQYFRDQRLIRRFFFIRFGDERGPHIRLRLLPLQAADRRKIMRDVKTYIPGAKFVAYIPETKRYGGDSGVPIAESLFDGSSLAILRLIAGSPSWSYSRALASAMQLHLGMLHAFGLDRQETTALFAHISQDTVNKPAAGYFEKIFTTQRNSLVPQLRRVWDACEHNVEFDEEWFKDWHNDMKVIGTRLRQAYEKDRLILLDSPQHGHPLWCLYESYIHMSNNRLGIMRRDEALITYILHQSLTADYLP